MDAQASVILGQITASERNKDVIVQTISVIVIGCVDLVRLG